MVSLRVFGIANFMGRSLVIEAWRLQGLVVWASGELDSELLPDTDYVDATDML